MKKIKHWVIYIVGAVVAAILMGISFIQELNCDWRNIFCGVGTSGIGAIVLAAVIEWQDESRRIKHNKAIFQSACLDIKNNIYRLLIVLYRIIKEINGIFKIDTIKFKNIGIEQLIDIYDKALSAINYKLVPTLCTDEEITTEISEEWREQSKAKEAIQARNEELDKFRETFNQLKTNFETIKVVLLANQISDKKTIEKVEQALLILSEKSVVYNESAFSRAINALKEIVKCGLIDALKAIGVDNQKFDSDKGYLAFAD